jgi:hypothetical protein
MTIYSSKPYASFLYGTSTPGIHTISPDRGPSSGGQLVIVEGSVFNPSGWDDAFTGASLDASKWSDISTGTGSVSTNAPNLELSTGATASSVAGIESLASWDNCQFEIKVFLPVVDNPISSVRPIEFQLYVSATDYAVLYVELDSSGSYMLHCDVYRNGSSVDTYSTICSSGSSVFRILRWDSTVYFMYNGTVIHSSSSFVDTSATVRLFNENLTVTEDIFSTVEYFKWKTYVSFGDQVVPYTTVVSYKRLRAYTPPSVDDKDISGAYAGTVDVSVVAAALYTYAAGYEYYFEDRLRVMNIAQDDVKLSIIDDDQLITDPNSSKGL